MDNKILQIGLSDRLHSNSLYCMYHHIICLFFAGSNIVFIVANLLKKELLAQDYNSHLPQKQTVARSVREDKVNVGA